jgi:hypothetical protein
MKSYLIDASTGVIVWFILIILIYGVIKLIKKEKLNTMYFKGIIIASILLGAISPTYLLINGKYQSKSELSSISKEDEDVLKTIIKNCFSGVEISNTSQLQFWSVVEKNKLTANDLDEFFKIFDSQDLIQMQKSFYEDALLTLKNKSIQRSEKRIGLENKLLNAEQKNRNEQYLVKIINKEAIPMNGEMIVLDQEMCEVILSNLDSLFIVGRANIEKLKNKNSFK